MIPTVGKVHQVSFARYTRGLTPSRSTRNVTGKRPAAACPRRRPARHLPGPDHSGAPTLCVRRSRCCRASMTSGAPGSTNEESSGIIEAFDLLGAGWYLLDVQAHYALPGDPEIVEGGQLLAMYVDPNLGR